MHTTREAGTGLIEAVTATAIVATALALLAGLSSVALTSILLARDRSLSVVFAHAKFDELRAQAGPLAASPPDTLTRDVSGWVDYLDDGGLARASEGGARGRVYARRWAVGPRPGVPGVVDVGVRVGRCVTTSGQGGCTLATTAVVVTGVRAEAP